MRTARVLLLAAVAAGLGATVPAHSAPVATCLVVSDAAGDPEEIESPDQARAAEAVGDSADPASDVRAVRLGSNGDLLVAEVRVADLVVRRAGSSAHRWQVAWRGAAGQQALVWAEQAARKSAMFGWVRDGDTGEATGSLDASRNVIRIEAPASLLGVADGNRLTNIQAVTSEVAGSAKVRQRDAAPDQTDYGVAYVSGVPCAQQDARACPVVLDPTRDAGTLIRRGNTDLPDSPPAVDLIASGATSDAETIHLSVRVVRPGAAPPQGYATVGWTVSWVDGARHWYAQAHRAATGVQYTYGIDGGAYSPSGPISGGVVTTGRIAGRTVEIDVPRAALGNPADGGRWTKFGATAWALSDTGTDELGAEANPFRIFDETELARWRTGVACGA